MAPIQAPVLYTETRLDLDEAAPGSTIELTLPSNSATPSSPPTRRVVSYAPSSQNEDTFTKLHLATDASIFFRRQERSPRVFLWRMLDGRKVLELQAVDLYQDKNVQGDATLTLHLR